MSRPVPRVGLGMAEKDAPGLRLARRYVTMAARRLAWSFARLNKVRARYIPRDYFSAYAEAKMQEEVSQKIKLETVGIPVPGYADLTHLRATPVPPAGPGPAPENEPIVEPPYSALPPRSVCEAPAVEPAPVVEVEEEKRE